MKIWTLIIQHRHGTNVSVHRSEASAKADLTEWVDLYWEHELPGKPKPKGSEQAIKAYFNSVEDELADIEKHELPEEQ